MLGVFMKKSLILFITVLILLLNCGCSADITENDGNSSDIEIIFPLDDTVNGYRQDGIAQKAEETSEDGGTDNDEVVDGYYVNTKTKKFHKLSCTYAQKGSQNGIWTECDRDTLIEQGNSPCSKCNP